MFLVDEYNAAIKALEEARDQTAKGKECEGCSICGDGHPVYECGRNPLRAIEICKQIANQSDDLHEILHELAGYNTFMGEQKGPAAIGSNINDYEQAMQDAPVPSHPSD